MMLWIARHGETADNFKRIFQGQAGAGLNRLGREQAERLAERMRRLQPAVIIASDLERAHETAQIVASACGLSVEVDRDLREVDVGTWTGKTFDEVRRLYPEEWAAAETGGLDVRRGGGETYAELAIRVDRAMRRIAERYPSAQRVLVVTHGGAIKSWVAKVLRLSRDSWNCLSGVANCGLTVVEPLEVRPRVESDFRLHSWNDVAHLEGLVVSEFSD